MYLLLVVLSLRCCAGLSLVVEGGVYSPVTLCRLLIEVASLTPEHALRNLGFGSCSPNGSMAVVPGPQSAGSVAACPWAPEHRLSSWGPWAPEHRLSSCGTWALLLCSTWDPPTPGLEPTSPAPAGGLYHWATREALLISFFFFFTSIHCRTLQIPILMDTIFIQLDLRFISGQK